MMNTTRKDGKSLGVLILAAGQGTRMESVTPKVLHRICGKPMIFYALRSANALKPGAIGIVVGHGADEVKSAVNELVKEAGISRPVVFIAQKEALGSAQAVLESVPFLKKFKTALVMCGDSPLLTYESLYGLGSSHEAQKGQATLLTARLANPKGYGRILRTPLGDVLRVVEETAASSKELAVNEVNSGAYCFEVEAMLTGIKELGRKGAPGEKFLADVMELVRAKGGKINAFLSANPEEILGVNSRIQLAAAERIVNRRMIERMMLSGVTVCDPASTHVDVDVEIGADTVVQPFTIMRGKTKIGRQCRIGPFCFFEGAQVGNECEVRLSQLVNCRVLEKCVIGPFSNIRPDSVLGPRVKVGNFSEVKNSRIGFGSKIPHLSYIGDSEIMEDVNVGAGTITCNYDGKTKHKTLIGAKAFIGSNVNLVAPVKVGRGSKIGAGSTITEDVPDAALAIARARQVNKI